MTHDSLSITEASFGGTGSTEDAEAGRKQYLMECKAKLNYGFEPYLQGYMLDLGGPHMRVE
jgi:hypothetical protein